MESNETVKIILPLPSPYLSPNKQPGTQGGRMRKYALVQQARKRGKQVTLECGVESGPWGKAKMELTFFHSQKRRRDGPNYISMMKGSIDGIVDGGLLVDDDSEHLTVYPPEFKIDKECPRVELIITRIKE